MYGMLAQVVQVPTYAGESYGCAGIQLRDSTLFVQKLLVDSSKLGLTGHHSGCC